MCVFSPVPSRPQGLTIIKAVLWAFAAKSSSFFLWTRYPVPEKFPLELTNHILVLCMAYRWLIMALLSLVVSGPDRYPPAEINGI